MPLLLMARIRFLFSHQIWSGVAGVQPMKKGVITIGYRPLFEERKFKILPGNPAAISRSLLDLGQWLCAPYFRMVCPFQAAK
jgi:hypothetical protein